MDELTLPWPAKELSPNARLHWAQVAKYKKAYRMACFALALQAGWRRIDVGTTGDIHLWVDFYPPDKRHRDMDNMLASCKALFDGVADALEVNDKRFRLHPYVKDEIGGMVKLRITKEIV